MGGAAGNEERPQDRRPAGLSRLRIRPRPPLAEEMAVAQGKALVLTLRTVILVLDDAGEIDAQEVADLLLADTPIHEEIAVETFARLMIGDLIGQLRGHGPDRTEAER